MRRGSKAVSTEIWIRINGCHKYDWSLCRWTRIVLGGGSALRVVLAMVSQGGHCCLDPEGKSLDPGSESPLIMCHNVCKCLTRNFQIVSKLFRPRFTWGRSRTPNMKHFHTRQLGCAWHYGRASHLKLESAVQQKDVFWVRFGWLSGSCTLCVSVLELSCSEEHHRRHMCWQR